jgi:signal transduction histidine kinase
MPTSLRLPALHRSLSARLLVLTIAFVLIGEVLIYVPSISRFRLVYLEERIAAAHLATLSLEASDDVGLPDELEAELLDHAGVQSVTLRTPTAHLMLGELPPVDRIYDLREAGPYRLIVDAFRTLRAGGARTIRVIGISPMAPAVIVDVSLAERGLWNAMVGYSWRILNLSLIISVLTAILVYASLQLLIVRPLRRVSESVVAFRRHPEDAGSDLPPVGRGDEIGVVQNEIARMQKGLRSALAQKARLAALGGAVGKINHDLRNILATVMVLSDRLEQSADPKVRRVAPRIIESLERAARLCADTLTFARTEPAAPTRAPFALKALVDEVRDAVVGPFYPEVRLASEIDPGLFLHADRDQLYRVVMNLVRNACQAMPAGGRVRIGARPAGDRLVIEVEDEGQGIPEAARSHLFEPFAGPRRPESSGLGLAIVREILKAHGGDIELVRTGPEGTLFRFWLPAA